MSELNEDIISKSNGTETSELFCAKELDFSETVNTEDEVNQSISDYDTENIEETTIELNEAVIEPYIEEEASQAKFKSRELKSLLEAAKESNLETNIVHKRESRKSETFGSISSAPKRRNSTSSNESHQSASKRNMRSQNPEFVQKHRKFLKTVTSGHQSEDSEMDNAPENMDVKDDTSIKSSGVTKTSLNKPKILNVISKTPKRKRDSVKENSVNESEEKKTKRCIFMESISLKVRCVM